MKTLTKTKLLSALVLSAVVFMSSPGFATGNSLMEANLQKCEAAFKKAQSGYMTQADAWRARKEHNVLVREILSNLNKRNSEVSIETGEVLSNEEVLNNFKVMGRLLEMLAADHPAETDEWGYPLE